MRTRPKGSAQDAPLKPVVGASSDETLVAAAVDGDGVAFADLVSRHQGAAVRLAASLVGRGHAEDVVQEALLLAFREIAALKDRSKFGRWLMAITRWRALRAGRKESRHVVGRVSLDDSVVDTLSHLASDVRQSEAGDELLLKALESIPPEYAEVIRYHFLHDLPHQKIAEFLDLPLSTVKWRCFRGKEILRCTLSPEPTCPTVCRKGCARFPSV